MLILVLERVPRHRAALPEGAGQDLIAQAHVALEHHGGMPCQVGPRILTVEEALAIVDVPKASGYARTDMPAAVEELGKEIAESEDEAAE